MKEKIVCTRRLAKCSSNARLPIETSDIGARAHMQLCAVIHETFNVMDIRYVAATQTQLRVHALLGRNDRDSFRLTRINYAGS